MQPSKTGNKEKRLKTQLMLYEKTKKRQNKKDIKFTLRSKQHLGFSKKLESRTLNIDFEKIRK